jgi:predicted AAA+ superfamily ATPase
MDAFYTTHDYLVKHVQSPVRRKLMDEIDWAHRLIGIKGSRGVGKTTFLLQYAKENYKNDPRCLYVNFNNFYFTLHSLVEFASNFYEKGGRILLIDQTFKYENWSKELRECYDRFPELRIIFSASSVMRLHENNDDIGHIVRSYNLRGFSFREFINLQAKTSFEAYTLENIINNHVRIAENICSKINPFDYFDDYLHHGYYPFFLENRNFSENLLKTMNMELEVDILLIKQIDLKYLSKIRKLLYLLMLTPPSAPNVSKLSVEIETSRATIVNYIKYLQDARLLNLLYMEEDEFPKKPNQIFVHNTNLMHAVNPGNVDKNDELKTFFYNTIHSKHKVNLRKYQSDFLIDRKIPFRCEDKNIQKTKHISKIIHAVHGIEVGTKNEIPLWLFGFLY